MGTLCLFFGHAMIIKQINYKFVKLYFLNNTPKHLCDTWEYRQLIDNPVGNFNVIAGFSLLASINLLGISLKNIEGF
jgi:hypothetical protein